MADIGKMALVITANAQGVTEGVAKAKAAMSGFAADATRAMEKVKTPDMGKAIGESMAKAQAAFSQRNKLGAFKQVDFLGGAAANQAIVGEANKLAGTIAGQYPKLAEAAKRSNLALVRVNEQGRQQVLKAGLFGFRYVDLQSAKSDMEKALRLKQTAWKAMGWTGGAAMGAARMGASGVVGAGLLGAGAAGAGLGVMLSGVNSIMQTDRQARTLGMSVSELRTLMLAAGDGADVMGEAMGHLGNKMAQARMGQTEALRTFANLGALSGKKVTADVFELPPVDSYRAVLERLAEIPDATQQAGAAFRVFGQSAAMLLPEIAKGAAGLDRAQQVLRNFGLGVGDKDLANVRQVAQTMRELGALKQGFFNQVTLGFAPIVAQLSKVFDVAKVDISGVQNAVINMAETIAKAGAFVVEAWKDTNLVVEAWRVAAKGIEGVFFAMLGKIAHAIDRMFSGISAQVTMLLSMMPGGMLPAIGVDRMAGGAKDAGDAFKGWADQAFKEMNDLKKVLGADLKGLPAFQAVEKFFADVRNNVGGMQGAGKALAPLEHLKNLMAEMGQAALSLRSPLEEFQDQMRRIGEMDKAGLFAGNEDLMARMTHKAFADLAGKMPPVVGATSALRLGTRESYSAVEAFRRGADRQDVPGILRAMKEEAARMQREQNLLLDKILNELRKDDGDDIIMRGI